MTQNDSNLVHGPTALQTDRDFRRIQLPRPRPDQKAWDDNFKLALASDPRRRENYERYLAAQKSEQLDYLPIRLDVENVSRCNFHCTMCQVSGWGPKYQRAGDMTLEEFKQLVDQQYGLMEIKLHGMGEPLLGRDDFFEMIRYARSKNIWVRTSSNGSLFRFRDNYKKLVDSGINEVQISFDGATKETFEEIRRGSKFELVVDNCTLINEYCGSRDLLLTRMWVLLQEHNSHEFLDFVKIAKQMGFKRLTYSLTLHGWGQENWEKINRTVNAEDDITPEMAQQAIDIGREIGVEVTFWNVTDKYKTTSPDTLCPWPFQWAYVSSDLRVVPCCMIANPEISDLGDAKSLDKVWNDSDYQAFRKAHLDGEIPSVCKACYLNESHHGNSS